MAEEAAQEVTGKKKGKKRLIIILALVVILGGGGGAYFFLLAKPAKKEAVEHVEEVVPILKSFPLETFIVNLSNSGNFLKTTLEVEYDAAIIEKLVKLQTEGGSAHGGGPSGGGEAPSGPPPMILSKVPMIRDVVISILSSKSGDTVLAVAGRETLKQELVDGINEVLGLDEAPVVNVYFIEFVVQ